MAYVRKKGHQVALVHGERDPETGKVVQRTLFTFFSKAEAYRAIGKGKKDESFYFQNLLQEEYPDIRFNWKNINEGISLHLDSLPDLAEYKEKRLSANFVESLQSFTREIVQADPQMNLPAARLLLEYREKLEFLMDVIEMKMELTNTAGNAFNTENEFYWRQTLRGSGINGDVEELASQYYKAGEYDSAIEAFELLVNSFPNYAEGHNYLGLIYSDIGDLEKSIEHFKKAIELGRKMIPKTLKKEHYWLDLKTRPYIRGLRNLALMLNRAGEYEEALSYCSILDRECGDHLTASSYRASAYLNLGEWNLAEKNALKVSKDSPIEAAIAAFAQFEQGRLHEARSNFLFCSFNKPLSIQILIKNEARKPEDFMEARDYNEGIEIHSAISLYLSTRGTEFKKFFSSILADPAVSSLIKEVLKCSANHSKLQGEAHTANFKRWHEIRGFGFAKHLSRSLERQGHI